MSTRLLLMSPDALMEITMQDPDVSFTLSGDFRSAEIQHPYNNVSPYGSLVVGYTLTAGDEVVTGSQFTTKTLSDSECSVRIDSLFSNVFDATAELSCVEGKVIETILSFHPGMDKLYSLSIDFFQSKEDSSTVLTPIHSDFLKVGFHVVPVSRELLSLHSCFFASLFYGSFNERNQEVKEIKGIFETEFVEFIHSLHCRRFEITSVKCALDTFVFSDQFLVPHVSKGVLPYLMDHSLSEEMVECALISVDRVPGNEEIMAWILTQFKSKSEVLKILHSILPSISNATAQMCLELGIQRISEIERENERIQLELEEERNRHNIVLSSILEDSTELTSSARVFTRRLSPFLQMRSRRERSVSPSDD